MPTASYLSPLTADTFMVDNSMLDLITTCPWLAYASILRRRRPAGDQPALRFGGILHEALAARYDAYATVQMQIDLMETRFREQPCEMEGWRNFMNAVKVIRAYNSFYEREDFEVVTGPSGTPMVEQAFAVDTHKRIRGRRVVYVGKIDLGVRYPDGSKYTLDHKTTSMMGDTFWEQQQMSGQHKGYLWSLREITGEEYTGFIVNAIGCKKELEDAVFDETLGTVVPGLTKSGRQSKATPVEFMRQRYFTKVPPGQLDEWFDNMLDQVDAFLYHVERGSFPRHWKHCIGMYGRCQFFNVCSLPSGSREQALTSGAYVENDWTPLRALEDAKEAVAVAVATTAAQ